MFTAGSGQLPCCYCVPVSLPAADVANDQNDPLQARRDYRVRDRGRMQGAVSSVVQPTGQIGEYHVPIWISPTHAAIAAIVAEVSWAAQSTTRTDARWMRPRSSELESVWPTNIRLAVPSNFPSPEGIRASSTVLALII
jgi:hypothetical protein